MRTSLDPRHKKRKKAVKELFSWSFQARKKQKIQNKFTKNILGQIKEIDKIIEDSAPQFPLKQINKIDLAILRIAVYELAFGKTAPYKVIIDEAIELAKEFGSEKSSNFINGALGAVIRKHGLS